MRSHWIRFSLMVLFSIFVLNITTAQGIQGSISGRVLDAVTNQPISGALVSVDEHIHTLTAADGTFAINTVPISGEYAVITITVQAGNHGMWTMPDTPIYAGVERLLNDIILTTESQTVKSGWVAGMREESQPLPPTEDVLNPAFFSHDVIPTTIRVALTDYLNCSNWLAAGQPINEVVEMPFKEYVKGVLGNEWVSSWHTESLRAGAMAVKMFGWHRINLGTLRPGDAHVVDNTCDQVYLPNSEQSTTSAAVDDTWNSVMRVDSKVVEIHYLNTDDNCEIYFPNVRCMGQWGSKALADEGQTWQDILRHYYDPIELTIGTSDLPFIPTNEDVIRNGNFTTNANDWIRFGDVTRDVSNGVLTFQANTTNSGIFQNLHYRLYSGSTVEMAFLLGNSAALNKSVRIRLWDSAQPGSGFECSFNLPANSPLQSYVVRGSSGEWSNPRLEIAPNGDSTPSVLMDEVQVFQRPNLSISGTQCLDPDDQTNWNFSSGPGAWISSDDLAGPYVVDNTSEYVIKGSNPYLTGPSIDVDTGSANVVTLQIAVSDADCARIYFQRSTETSFSQYITFDLTPDGAQHTYTIQMDDTPTWNGIIQRLRLSFDCATNPTGGVRVSSIQLEAGEGILALLSPAGTISEGYGNPLYIWQHLEGADHYSVYVGTQNGRQVAYERLPADTVCNGALCTIDLTLLSDNYRIINDDYVVYLRAWINGQPESWRGPFRFKLDAIPPAPVSLIEPTNQNTSRPTLNWQLNGDAQASASWFRLYAAPSNALGSPLIDTWVSRFEACSGLTATTCQFHSDANFANGTYHLYMQSWGPGGFSAGGSLDGWAGPGIFHINGAVPDTPQNINISVADAAAHITWESDPAGMWYAVYVLDSESSIRYGEWHDQGEVCNGLTCTLIPNAALSNGDYSVWMQAWGPGGLSDWTSANFTVNVPSPQGITPLPLTAVNSGRPIFFWEPDENASWYFLWIAESTESDDDAGLYGEWLSAAESCGSQCRIRPPLDLAPDRYRWSVLAWGPGGSSDYIHGESFTVNPASLSIPFPLTPTGTVYHLYPALTWEHLPDAAWYNVEIRTNSTKETVYNEWLNMESIGCEVEGICTLHVDDPRFYVGAYDWRIRAYNPAGIGSWSPWAMVMINS